jgi:hypothetical protein
VRRDRRAMRIVAHSDAAKIFSQGEGRGGARAGRRARDARARERTNERTNESR